MKGFGWLGWIILCLGFFGCTATAPQGALADKANFLDQDYSAVEAEIIAWSDSLGAALKRLNPKEINNYHLYSDKFTRLEYMPDQGGVRMDQVAGKKREDDYFGSLDKFEQTFSERKIDVLGERHAIVTMRYEFQGYKDGAALHEPLNVWLTFFLVKPLNDWKIVYESLVPVAAPVGTRP